MQQPRHLLTFIYRWRQLSLYPTRSILCPSLVFIFFFNYPDVYCSTFIFLHFHHLQLLAPFILEFRYDVSPVFLVSTTFIDHGLKAS